MLDFYYNYRVESLQVKTKIWIEVNNQAVFGHGKYVLLQKIEELKSLNKAAHELKMSYRHAWAYIKSMEERLGEKILETTLSGSKKSGSNLTEFAQKLLNRYKAIDEKLNAVMKAANRS
ncbi:MAG: hypothetical protein A2X42_08850 [Candidatus Margulisbacteria bacterium GWF2_38_17]|nr:MAG: hypothetical protein A2X43_06470 [Candidatus Margulisbacteria bacterium GWD2_39_127]OGI05612.1 MAG: hypothetical protein A2X42_08850 [Candidatus Margulisbacteria bacterium GWF2_38_17]OGI07579.1 MAG: hypothetical protein A2X41_08755 [Candidatus Margulisbacteria bacterium GWE2_39_32]